MQNGIIHNCTHGNDPDVKLTEEEMIVKIFNYLDKLFHIAKPQVCVDASTGTACIASPSKRTPPQCTCWRSCTAAEASVHGH